jgi:protein SCO1/2
VTRVIAALSFAAALACCRGPTTAEHASTNASSVAGETSKPPSAESEPRNSTSVYALSMTLTDQEGKACTLDVFRGKPVFVGMFYASCPSACPMLISTIKRIVSELDSAVRDEVRVLLVSFDPEHDRPEVLRATVERRGLDAHWKLASAPEDQVRDLAAVLGIQYRRLPDGSFAHSSSVLLLDRSGSIAARIDDLDAPTDSLVAGARSAVSK